MDRKCLGSDPSRKAGVAVRGAVRWEALLASTNPHLELARKSEERFWVLLVTQKLGVQIERVYFSGKRSYEFVDIDTIEDVIINEGITRCKIVHYMAFLLSTKSDPLVVFETFPPRKMLEAICHGTREVLGQGK